MNSFFPSTKAYEAEQRRRAEQVHSERMHAIELGQPVPEVQLAQARVQETRARAIAASVIVRTVFMAVGPLAIGGVAIGAMSVVLTQADAALHRFLISIIWGAAVLMSLIVIVGLRAIGPASLPSDFDASVDLLESPGKLESLGKRPFAK